MSLSRRRKKELKRLKGHAEELWQEQTQVLERANTVLREAKLQAGHLTNEEVVPRVKDAYESHLKDRVDTSVRVGKAVAGTAKDKLVDEVLPSVAAVIGSALSVANIANDSRIKDALGKVSKKVPVVPQKKGIGAGGVVLIILGIVAVAGVAYAAWQTFRADDDLWVADDEPETPPSA